MTGVIDLSYKKAVNPELLREELAAVLGEKLVGTSTSAGQLRVHILDDTSQELRDRVSAVVATHDPAQMTVAQQTTGERKTALEDLQRKPWIEWTETDKETLLQFLAEFAFASWLAGD